MSKAAAEKSDKTEAASKKKKCGLIMPISAIDGCSEGHWQNVKLIIEEALDELGLDVSLVSDADEVGIIQARIIQNIYDNDIVVCDVSCKNPNVMFELGMRLAFDKPTVVIKDDLTSYSFDTSPLEHLTYPRSLHYNQIQEFKTQLKFKVEKTLLNADKNENSFLKNFGKFVIAKIEGKEVGSDSYIIKQLEIISREIAMIKNAPAMPSTGRFVKVETEIDKAKSVMHLMREYVKAWVNRLSSEARKDGLDRDSFSSLLANAAQFAGIELNAMNHPMIMDQVLADLIKSGVRVKGLLD